MERPPKEIPVARLSKRRHLAHVVVKAKDITGAMSSISQILSSEEVDVRQSAAFAIEKEGYFIYNAFVWFKKEGYRPQDLTKKLRTSSFVLDVVVKDGVEGSVVDTVAFPLQFAGQRVVMLETRALKDMFEKMESVFGTGGSVIVQQEGFSYGRAQAAELAKVLTRPYMIRNYRYGLMMLMATGWGIPTVLTANEALTNVTVRIDECFECAGRKDAKESGHFMAGYLAGVLSLIHI